MAKTFADARRMTIQQPGLLILLAIGLFYGLYSEWLDRLWTVHLLESFVPFRENIEPVVWVGPFRGLLVTNGMGATEVVRRRLSLRQSVHIGVHSSLWLL